MDAAKEPNLVCPFTGKPIEVIQVGGGNGWLARCGNEDGGWASNVHLNRDDLIYFLSTRMGVKPAFPKHPRIEVRESAPSKEDAFADVREQATDLDARAQAVAAAVFKDREKRKRAAPLISPA